MEVIEHTANKISTGSASTGAAESFKTVLLNLPHEVQIMRRYMCSSLAPNYLFPPQELIALGGIVRDWKKDEVHLLDAVAEKLDMEGAGARIEAIAPHIIITISGFESFGTDMEKLTVLKKRFPDVTFILFGHYPTQFPAEVLNHVPVDYIILGEPDLIFDELYDCIQKGEDLTGVKGIAYRNEKGEPVIQKSEGRIPDPNVLPMPAYELLANENYNEPFMPKPFGMIQTARGCPYQCNYCVKSFGTKLTALEPQRIVDEIKFLIDTFQIKSLRFIDDTFTVIPKRVITLCKLMIENNIKVQWTCLSRVDTINEEMLMWMKKAGCKRICFGIESGSQRILDLYHKGVDIEKSIANVLLCRKYGIETAGFFLSGYPEETEEDLKKSIDYAIRCKLNFIAVAQLIPYPGTSLFKQLSGQINFSLFPYKSEFINNPANDKYVLWESIFFHRFYFRPSYVVQNFPVLWRNTGEIFKVAKGLVSYMLKTGDFSVSEGLANYARHI